MLQNIMITVLTVAAFVLSTIGLLGARQHAAMGIARMERERTLRDRIRAEAKADEALGGMRPDEWQNRHAAVGLEPVTYETINQGREFLAERIVRELDRTTKSDVVLIGLGLLCGLVASVWSIWIP